MEGQTPLHLAVINKQYDAAFELILSFAEIIHDIKNLTPIDYALQFPENERIRLMMTDFQEEKDIKKAIGNKEKFNNLLHTSQRKCGIFAYQLWNDVLIYGSKDDFDTLINEKFNINVENPIDKKTPLHQVCEFGNLYYAKTLIENGANINLKFRGKSSLSLALEHYPKYKNTNIDEYNKLIHFLIKNNVNIGSLSKYDLKEILKIPNIEKLECYQYLKEARKLSPYEVIDYAFYI